LRGERRGNFTQNKRHQKKMILPANAATRKETLVFTGMRTSIVLSRLNVFERNYKSFRHKLAQEGKYASGLLPFKEKKKEGLRDS